MRWRNSILLLLWACPAHGAYVVTQTGRQINGVSISASDNGSVTLNTASGQKLTFRKGQYREAVADKPPELAKAEQLLAVGQGGDAEPLLQRVVRTYRYLGWDQTAAHLLADHLYETGQYAEAAEAYSALENRDGPIVSMRYREALLKSGDSEAVLQVLNADIGTGSREAAARAYLMRGDLKMADGDSEGARRDWFKVALLFREQKETAKQAEERLKE